MSILLAAAIGVVGWNTYLSWKMGPWDLPGPVKSPAQTPAAAQPVSAPARVITNTDVIVSRNLFDPERGAGATREAEETSRAFQRVRNLILIGTVIIGNNRTAILQDGAGQNMGPAVPPQSAPPMRLKLGDNIEGYRLAEIADKKVVFAKESARVEVALDYFRRVDVPAPRQPTPPGQVVAPSGAPTAAPRVIPNLPRRGRIPVPGNPNPDS